MRHVALLVFLAIVPASATYCRLDSSERQPECPSDPRDHGGQIRPSPAARRAFQATHPCPATGSPTGSCPGYVVDHIVPLKRGGVDDPNNMQWRRVKEAKAKDRADGSAAH